MWIRRHDNVNDAQLVPACGYNETLNPGRLNANRAGRPYQSSRRDSTWVARSRPAPPIRSGRLAVRPPGTRSQTATSAVKAVLKWFDSATP